MRRQTSQNRNQAGFTLIELMVVVAIIAILAAVAMPSYTDYVRRGKIAEATSTLSEMRLKAEKWFSDNRTYVVGVPDWRVVPGTRYFAYDCGTPTATAFTCTAVGIANQGTGGMTYTINQDNTKTSTFAGLSGWNNSATCWVGKKGDSC